MGLVISTAPVVAREWAEGFFSSFRHNGLPTMYPPNKTAVTVDVLETGFIYAALTVAISFFFILPGIRGWERLYCFIRFSVSLFIGVIIMLGLWGNGWEVGHVHTRTQYRAFTGYEIEADIGLKIGLHNMNITLTGTPLIQQIGDVNETINYNERFWWSFPWGQRRIGFGKFSSGVNQEFREAQYKGLPYPILWVAEYFIFDGEGIRWGRYYRHAGFYTHVVLWTAFPLWILSNIMFFMVPRNGAFFLLLTGLCMVSGNIIYASYRNPTAMEVPFEDGRLVLFWGANFWLNLVAGALCLIIGCFVYLCDWCGYDSSLSSFFGTNELRDVDEYYLDDAAVPEVKQQRGASQSTSSVEEGLISSTQGGAGDDEVYTNQDLRRNAAPKLKKRGFTLRKTAPKKKPRPIPRVRAPPKDVIIEEEEEDHGLTYENVEPGPTVRFANKNGLEEGDVNLNLKSTYGPFH